MFEPPLARSSSGVAVAVAVPAEEDGPDVAVGEPPLLPVSFPTPPSFSNGSGGLPAPAPRLPWKPPGTGGWG